MLAVNYTNLRENMKTYMDKVTDDYETMIVTRKDNRNVVMISEESYNNLMENVYVMGNKANYERLMESKKPLENGIFKQHKLIEVSGDEKCFYRKWLEGLCILADRGQKDFTENK